MIQWWQILLLTLYSTYQICDELTIVSSAGSPAFIRFITGLSHGNLATGLLIGGSLQLFVLRVGTFGGASRIDATSGAVLTTFLVSVETNLASLLCCIFWRFDVLGRGYYILRTVMLRSNADYAAIGATTTFLVQFLSLSRALPVFFALAFGGNSYKVL